MIVAYVRGDGLGHLTRLRAFLHTLGRAGEPVTLLTASTYATDPRVTAGYEVVRAPGGLDRTGLARWTAATLADLAPDELVVDAFPAGLRGELTAAAVSGAARVVHLARLLRWDAYRPLLPADPPRFDRTYVLEPLDAEHLAHVRAHSAETAPLELSEPPVACPAASPGGWLVVHAGPEGEVQELLRYARDMAALENVRPRLTLVSPRRPAHLPGDVGHLDIYPAWPLFAQAERVITAAGFNAVRQLAPWRDRHRMLPFPRSLDDQFTRAARHR
ncbi:hypothetical protein [Actinomadura miaoliensis]|uniref:Glycosyl transferase n=1 Tax=Actinomadura miaoliensis TaxID=430685 RepID=A0ABP7VAT4_9ACTN